MRGSESHSDFVAQVAKCVRGYYQGELNQSAVDRLVRLAAKTAQQKLWGRLSAASQVQETTVEQQALSAVGTLFIESAGGSLLANALEASLESDDVALFQRFQAVVVRFASQELFHRWDENDPLSARLWRNLQRGLRHDPRLRRFPQEKPIWVTLAGEDSAHVDLVQLNWHEIRAFTNNWHRPDAALADLVVEMLSNPKLGSPRTSVVSIEMLFAALRETRATTVSEELSAKAITPVTDPHLQTAIDKATEATRLDTVAKLMRYGSSGKLCPDALEHFRNALVDLLADCSDGGPATSHYKYLSTHWSGLTYEDYRKLYRTKFEYLAEYVQDRFAKILRENYGS